VFSAFTGSSKFDNQGERVVEGQRLMQATSDIFLGWLRQPLALDGVSRDFYVRQLKDWKFAADPQAMQPGGLSDYGKVCGWTLARAHARSGDRIAIAAYLGNSDSFDRRSPTSPPVTPTRTSATTRRSTRQRGQAAS
jgi:hypothetical protein